MKHDIDATLLKLFNSERIIKKVISEIGIHIFNKCNNNSFQLVET